MRWARISLCVLVTSMTLLGYFLGGIPLLRRNFEKFVLLVIFISVLPLIVHAVRLRFARKPPIPAAAD